MIRNGGIRVKGPLALARTLDTVVLWSKRLGVTSMTLLDLGVNGRGFEALDEEECLALLAGKGIGRVAVTMEAMPVVLPVNYCCVDGAIAFRTGEGMKLSAATEHAVVAFEVDDIDPVTHTGWSVLAVGIARTLTTPADLKWAEMLPLRPWAPGSKHHVVRLVPEFLSGRRITDETEGSQAWH